MSIRSHIDKAGAFPVIQLPCPHYNEKVDLGLPRTGCLHTTEGGWRGSYGVFKVHFAPHFALGWNEQAKKAEIAQLVPVGTMAATTRAHNNMLIVQIEMIAYSEETLWLPGSTKRNPHPETLDALSSLMNVCWHEWGIPLTHPWKDGDFGRASDNPHRHANILGKVATWLGHGDMPNPDSHYDPGALEWSKVFAHCHELETANVVA